MSIRNLAANDVVVSTPTDLDAIRRPQQFFTDEYLNDPIQVKADQRFEPQTVVQQFPGLPNQIARDFASYVQIDRNDDSPQLMTLNMFSNLIDRDKYNNTFIDKTEFSQF